MSEVQKQNQEQTNHQEQKKEHKINNPNHPDSKSLVEKHEKSKSEIVDATKKEHADNKSQMQTELLKYLKPDANGGEEAVIKKFQKEHWLKETWKLNAKTFNAIKSYNDEFLSDPKKFKEFMQNSSTTDSSKNTESKTENDDIKITNWYPEKDEVFMTQEVPVLDAITAWETNELSKKDILNQLKEAWIDAKELKDKPGTYDLDLDWLFDDSTLQVLWDNKMKFQTSKYEKDWKPKEFNISSVDELKTILKSINDLSKAKQNLNSLNDKNNPDNHIFKSEQIDKLNSQVGEITKNLDSKA